MPLIRYRTQDFGRIENGIITSLDGRIQEFLVTQEGRRMSGTVVTMDKFIWDYVHSCQIVQDQVGKLNLRVVPRRDFDDSVRKLILSRLRERYGTFFTFDIQITDEILRGSSGKARKVISNLR